MTHQVTLYSLKDTPSLIEYVFPVQRLSIDVYKERMGGSGQTLTGLGSYWKGRKPLVLSRACVLASLLPATKNLKKDLEIFELLMGMDDESLRIRLNLKLGQDLPKLPYKNIASKAKRVEELADSVHDHIWDKVNQHIGTNAKDFPDLVEQLGLMRFGRRPVVSDTFSGSGQIPFAAAQLGCDVIASDINPIACLLTWASFNIVGADEVKQLEIAKQQREISEAVFSEIDRLQIEVDGSGWSTKAFLYCIEVVCPESGWRVPLLPTLIISKDYNVIAKLIPDHKNKRYDIDILSGVTDQEVESSKIGTLVGDSLIHKVGSEEFKTKISTIRGDQKSKDSGTKNNLRLWEKQDIVPKKTDIYQERLYCIQWVKARTNGRLLDFEFRAITEADLGREQIVIDYVQSNLSDWQAKGFVPDMKIEPGHNTDQPIRERGWTYWHHLFNPRQLLMGALLRKNEGLYSFIQIPNIVQLNARLSRWDNSAGGRTGVKGVFDNQALNTLYNYGCRGFIYLKPYIERSYKFSPLNKNNSTREIQCGEVSKFSSSADIFITDPPYGDAVKYEEILEFFIAWLRKDPPKEFSDWVWDSRRALAIKGEDHDFKLSMVLAYKRMAECMPDNGLQVVMFTHQDTSIWADMANIVWASGLKVSAAWYIVTETESALRDGQYVKGTILLVLRKRTDQLDSFRDELAYELKDEVENQVELLTGLNSDIKDLYRDENLFEDADIQMAGYAAALRVLTKYSVIDGVDMAKESLRPRIKGQVTLVDDLIEFAVDIANQYLVPQGLSKEIWDALSGVERFYLKMLDMESRGIYTLSNYQNFAKAFKVEDFSVLIGESKANKVQLKTAEAFGKRGMGSGDEFGTTKLRSILYGIHLLSENKISSDEVLHQLKDLVPDFYRSRELLVALAGYINEKTSGIRESESQSARVLRDLIRNERV
jgi:putative DNA methylase